MKRTYFLLAAPLLLQWPGCASSDTPAASALSTEEMMEKMTELAAPGAEHGRLASLEGQFTTRGVFWMEPDAPPTEAEGISSNRWILGGRFLQQEYQSQAMGQPFTGVGWTGFNNVTQEYEGVWVDSMGTQIMPVARGTCDATGKVITFRRTFVDPMTGEEATSREVLTLVDHNRYTFEWFQASSGEPEQQFFRIEYTRR